MIRRIAIVVASVFFLFSDAVRAQQGAAGAVEPKLTPEQSAKSRQFVRIDDRTIVMREASPDGSSRTETARAMNLAGACNMTPRAYSGMPAPDGGTLGVIPSRDPAPINAVGQLAFFSPVIGPARNQGIFVADSGGVHAVVIGCGDGGGTGNPGTNCGDPSPIGGRFSGLYGGSSFAPDMNNAGDVLFFADVFGGTSSRGLFVRRASSGQIVKVAAVGDPSPLGGVFGALGTGSLSGTGKVVFLASAGTSPGADVNIFLWNNGALSTVASVGQTIPGAGTIQMLGTEWFGFVDGTYIPVNAPDVNEADAIAYRPIFADFSRALVVRANGTDTIYVRSGDPTPAGGTYSDFFDPILNGKGVMAFFADTSSGTAAWFVGSPGSWRKALGFDDLVDGGEVHGLAVSHNPMRPLDEGGNLLAWCDLDSNGGVERMVLSRADGGLTIVARKGDPTPTGIITTMLAWPSTNDCVRLLGTGNAHFTLAETLDEVRNLRANRDTGVRLGWTRPDWCPSTVFDVARGSLSGLRVSGYPDGAFCAVNNVAEPEYAETASACAAGSGDGCWYLVRGTNACGPSTFGPPALDASSPCP